MLPVEFLKRLTPDHGYKYIAIPTKNGGFRHEICETHEQAAEIAQREDVLGRDVYFSLSSFREARVPNPKWVEGSSISRWSYRVGTNAFQAKAFWLDLDVSDTKNGCYRSQAEAIAALRGFVVSAKLPRPMLVSSGYGVHVYWPLDAVVPSEQWLVVAEQLKALTTRLGLLTDPSRTSDRSSVLRVIGTRNYKRPESPTVVSLLSDAANVVMSEFIAALEANGCTPRAVKATTPRSELDDLPVNLGINSVDPILESEIISRCAQMRDLKLAGGNVAEPYWYAGLQLLRYVDGGDSLKTDYSDGHADYSEDATQAKWDQLIGVGPTLCARFEEVNPGGCEGCAYRGLIKSPILLARKAGQAAPPAVEVKAPKVAGIQPPQAKAIPDPPSPFARTPDGKIVVREKRPNDETGETEEGITVIYEHDLYPIKQIDDIAQGGQVTTFRTRLPHEGWKEFSIRARDLYDRAAMMTVVSSVGMYVKPVNIPKLATYMIGYIAETQKYAAAQKQYAQMGWHEDDSYFINGPLEYKSDGTVRDVGVSDALKNSVKGMGIKGDLDTWKRVFNTYAQPGFEPHAFAALTAFGAPLFKFSGHSGVMLNMVGESGSGKSTVLRVINSVYGHPDGAMLNEKDSILSFYHRLGVANNLPVTFDEVTEMDPKNLSALCYAISQGRGKNRLKQDGSERENLTSWKTIIASTSNASLFDKLAHHKTDASAEAMRVFEYYVNQTNILSKEKAAGIFDTLADNYGVAGDVYIRHITANLPKIREMVQQIMHSFDTRVDTAVKERFWSSLVACNIAGGFIARQIGLHNYDMNALFEWIIKQVRVMRTAVSDNTQDPRAVLSGFLNKSVPNTIVVSTVKGSKDVEVKETPKAAMFIRVERHRQPDLNNRTTTKIFVSQREFKLYCVAVGADYTMVKRGLEGMKIVLSTNSMKVMGGGTPGWGNSGQTLCWLVDGDHPNMGGLSVRSVGIEPIDLLEGMA